LIDANTIKERRIIRFLFLKYETIDIEGAENIEDVGDKLQDQIEF
jgi:hypothetical protein